MSEHRHESSGRHALSDLFVALALARQAKDPCRPFITLAYAQTLDGALAPADGRLLISGPESERMTHALRARHEAILVGIGTVLTDDPRLTVRLSEGPNPQRVVLDTHLKTPPTATILGDGAVPPWIVARAPVDATRAAALETRGARIFALPGESEGVSLEALVAALHDVGIESLLVEGGGKVLTAFLSKGLVDFVVVTIGGLIAGGTDAVRYAAPAPYRLREIGTARLGDELLVWGSPEPTAMEILPPRFAGTWREAAQ